MEEREIFGDSIDFTRDPLANILDYNQPLYRLAVNFGWDNLESKWSVLFSKQTEPCSTNPRLIAGLMIIWHIRKLSDEQLVEQFTENFYYQFLCGEQYFTIKEPCHPASLSKWRKMLGEEELKKLIEETDQVWNQIKRYGKEKL